MRHGKVIRATWFWFSALAQTGCGQDECSDFRRCEPAWVGDAASGDVVLELSSGGFVSITTGAGEETDQVPESSTMLITPPEPGCTPTPATPCSLLLKRFEVRFAHMDWELTTGERLSIDDATVSLPAPAELENTGKGYVLGAGQSFRTCAAVDGRRQSGHAASDLISVLAFHETVGIFGIDASFPLVVRRSDAACSEFTVSCQAQLTFLRASD